MASAAEQMAANMSWGAFGKATELRQRILYTIGLLIVYRVGTYIPVPGIDSVRLLQFMESANQGIAGMEKRLSETRPDLLPRAADYDQMLRRQLDGAEHP